MFSIISRENLAFNSRSLFDLFEEVIPLAPDLFVRFFPQLEGKIKDVETKRGVGYDRSLR